MRYAQYLGALSGGSLAVLSCNGTDLPLNGTRASPDTSALTPASTPDAIDDAGQCVSVECPDPYATCLSNPGLCTTNLSNDTENCGACGRTCPLPTLSAAFSCAEGACVMRCTGGQGDCDGLVDTGCETDFQADPANCGGCGVTCEPGQICYRGACGCPPGFSQCENDCVDVQRDDSNCGACGKVCGPPDADAGAGEWPCGVDTFPTSTGFRCVNADCRLTCSPGSADCDGNTCDTGCETDIAGDPANCGACGHACAAGQVCQNGKCLCDPPLFRCPGDPDFYCADLQTDPLNCGSCGNYCPGGTCSLGHCGGLTCFPDFADCDGRIRNGCEVDLRTDPSHCGDCAVVCDQDAGQPCVNGQCLTKPCEPGDLH